MLLLSPIRSLEAQGWLDSANFVSVLNSKQMYALTNISTTVWQLRSWTRERSVPGAMNALQYTLGPDGTAYVTILCRSDGNPAPKWEHIEHLRDGRERLGYNPALENKGITREDWESVKANDEFVERGTGKRLKLPLKGGDRAALARL